MHTCSLVTQGCAHTYLCIALDLRGARPVLLAQVYRGAPEHQPLVGSRIHHPCTLLPAITPRRHEELHIPRGRKDLLRPHAAPTR
jgi:hypothetical protein